MSRLVIFAPDHNGWKPIKSLFKSVVVLEDLSSFKFLKGDVLLFEGGTDVNSALYNEPKSYFSDTPDFWRDAFEYKLFKRAKNEGIAMFGICRGAQFLCVMNGGSLIQHVTGHTSSHWITTEKELRYHVPSTHHQMMAPKGNFDLLAWSSEEISEVYIGGDNKTSREKLKPVHYREPEIVFWPETKCLSVQSHPEYLEKNDSFVKYCCTLIQEKLL